MLLEDLNRLIVCGNDESSAIVQELCNKYGCSKEKVYWTVRSVYGKKLRDLREELRTPSRDELLKAVFLAKDTHEVRRTFHKVSADSWKGMYDRVLGVSTFHKAKELALLEFLPSSSQPQTDNNEAMWAAFRLGDGSYDARRNSWRIEHCSAQVGWLERKVEMFVKAFPQASTRIRYNEKRDTYSWYSRKVGHGKFRHIGTCPKHEVVPLLNEFGIWLLFLDDGCYMHNKQQVISIAVENMEIATRLAEHINSMGFNFRVSNKNCITLTGMEQVLLFHKRFLEPFSNLTPSCMSYKTTYVKI